MKSLGVSLVAIFLTLSVSVVVLEGADYDSTIRFLRVEELKRKIDAGEQILVVDVRGAGEYKHGHILGAISIPTMEFATRYREIPWDMPVVLYCACPHALASWAAQFLYQKGYRKMWVLDEGLPGWKEKGYPLVGDSR